MPDAYPQAERSAWANAYADQCSAIWRLIDARREAALNLIAHGARREELRQRVVKAEADRDTAVAACRAAREAMDKAEAIYFAAVEAGACQPST